METPESKALDAAWAEQFERLAGTPWPPRNAAEWTTILVRAGFTQGRIDEFFDGDLPNRYVSAIGDEWPTFSAALVAGLERWRRDTKHDTPEKSRKKVRPMNAAAGACILRFREARRKDPTISMKSVVEEYIAATGNGKANSILRVLSDHPEQWKDDTKTTSPGDKKRR